MQGQAEGRVKILTEELKAAQLGQAAARDEAERLGAELEVSKAFAASAEEACQKEQAARKSALRDAEASYQARAGELLEKVKLLEAEHAGKEVVLTNKVHQLEMKVENVLRERDIVKVALMQLCR